MSIAVISHPDCLLHEMGRNHPECPDRVRVIETALKQSNLHSILKFYIAQEASYEELLRAHDKSYIDSIYNLSPKEGLIHIDPDTLMNPYTLRAAKLAAGSLVQAVDLVMSYNATQVFCNVRPPGHHATRSSAMGFCFFNNIAVGVEHALTQYNLKRVAIIDFDVHHGNGSEDIFSENNKILLLSSYQYPLYPNSPVIDNNPHVLHLPLPSGTSSHQYQVYMENLLIKVSEFQPEFIFISAGFDAHYRDPLAGLKLQDEDYYWISQKIFEIAKKVCKGRIVSSLEGGYALEVLGPCVVAMLSAFAE